MWPSIWPYGKFENLDLWSVPEALDALRVAESRGDERVAVFVIVLTLPVTPGRGRGRPVACGCDRFASPWRLKINRRSGGYHGAVRVMLHSGYEPLSWRKGLVVGELPDDRDIEDAEIASGDAAAAVAIPSALPTELPASDYTEAGVPTFDYVRDRIEGRFATSVGMSELAGDTPEAASLDEQLAAREQAGKDRLEEIRRAMRGE